MYLRWKHYEAGGARTVTEALYGGGRPLLTMRCAVVVECRRVNGKPRQRFVKHLGSIAENYIFDPRVRRQFWRTVDRKLPYLAAAEYERIIAQIARVVPRVTDSEVEAWLAAQKTSSDTT